MLDIARLGERVADAGPAGRLGLRSSPSSRRRPDGTRTALTAAKGAREALKLAGRALRFHGLASVLHFSFSPPDDPKVVPVGEKVG
jgi:hypothetical protein